MISLLIAGGISLAAPVQSQSVTWTDIDNHTLRGEVIPASQVVTRSRWGTPMLPDGKGGYSLIAPINPEYIAESLIIPPWNIPPTVTTEMVIYRPLPASETVIVTPAPVEAPVPVAPVAPAPGSDSTAPIDASLPLQ